MEDFIINIDFILTTGLFSDFILCTWLCKREKECVCVRTRVYQYVYVNGCVFECVCERECLCLRECVFVLERVCVHVCVLFSSLSFSPSSALVSFFYCILLPLYSFVSSTLHLFSLPCVCLPVCAISLSLFPSFYLSGLLCRHSCS